MSSMRRPTKLPSLTASADALDLLFQGYVGRIARLGDGGLICGWPLRRRAMIVSLAPRLGGLDRSERSNEDRQRQRKDSQQLLQIFPTVLSALLFS